jgi:hypothetical protein
MTSSAATDRPARLQRWLTITCIALVAYHALTMPAAWRAWRDGLPDLYAGQHRALLLGHVTGLALALSLPLPTMMSAGGGRTRVRRWALWAAWAALMVVTWVSLGLNLLP